MRWSWVGCVGFPLLAVLVLLFVSPGESFAAAFSGAFSGCILSLFAKKPLPPQVYVAWGAAAALLGVILELYNSIGSAGRGGIA
jgi:hypothetical protein